MHGVRARGGPARGRAAPAALAAVLLAGVLGTPSPRAARGEERVEDLDRRATLALKNSTSTDREWRLEEVVDAEVRALPLFHVTSSGGRAYATRFGGPPKKDESGPGYHRISFGETFTDLARQEWRRVEPFDAGGGAVEAWWRRRAGRPLEVTLRGRAGALMLTVSENRPAEETPPAAARDLAGRYERLRAAAWSAGLFARLRVSVVPENGGTGAELSPDPLLLSLPRPEARIRLRLEMVDAREAPVVPKALGVRLSGTGSDGARVEGMTRNAATGRWELVDPLVRTDVSIVVPASDALERALYAEAGAGTPSPLVVVASAVLRDAPGQTLDAPGAVSDARLRLVAWEPCLTTFVVAAPTGDEAGREDHGSVPTSAAHFEAWRRVLRAARSAPRARSTTRATSCSLAGRSRT